MKCIYKIALINVCLVFVLAALVFISDKGTASDFMTYAGVASILWSGGCILIGLLLLLLPNKSWAQGFLLSAGILLVLGFMECSFFGMLA